MFTIILYDVQIITAFLYCIRLGDVDQYSQIEKKGGGIVLTESYAKHTDSATGQSVTCESEQENSLNRSDTCSESTSFHPGSDRWDTLMDQAEISPILQENKRIELENRCGDFVDESPSFPVEERKVILPDSLSGIDRVEVGAQISDILKKEYEALSQARFYRNCCDYVQMRIRELENEKEGIRFFWRNQIGQSRAGRVLKLAVNSNNR